MTFSNFIDKLAWFFSLLYFRHWERSELLVIVLICLVLLLLITWQQRRNTAKSMHVNQISERSPVIGVKLADNRSRLRINNVKQVHTTPISKKESKQIKTKEQLAKLNEQVQQLQHEIDKHKQTEAGLKHQVISLTTELTTANEQLRQTSLVSNQLEQKPKQQIAEVPAVKEQSLSEPVESCTVRQQAKQQTGETKPLQKLFNRRINPLIQHDRHISENAEQIKHPKEIREQPLDIERLKSIADLAKRIQSRRRKSS